MSKNVQIPIPKRKIPHINFISIDSLNDDKRVEVENISFHIKSLIESPSSPSKSPTQVKSPTPVEDEIYDYNASMSDVLRCGCSVVLGCGCVLERVREQAALRTFRTAGSFRINYELSELIHDGDNASVHRAISYADHQIYAIKIYKTLRIETEYRILSQLNHPNIIKVYESYACPQAFIMDYNPQDLFSLLNIHKNYIEEPEAVSYTTNIANALSYIHSKGIMHRDIKPENVVIDEHNVAKLIDFDLCTTDQQSSQSCGTIEYMAPEVLKKQLYDFKVDIWSLGILFYEMLYSYTPFVASDMNSVKNRILMENIVFTDNRISTPSKTLLLWMLEKNPNRRPDYSGLLETLQILKEGYCNNRYVRRIKYLEDKIEDMKFLYYDKNIKKYREDRRRKSG